MILVWDTRAVFLLNREPALRNVNHYQKMKLEVTQQQHAIFPSYSQTPWYLSSCEGISLYSSDFVWAKIKLKDKCPFMINTSKSIRECSFYGWPLSILFSQSQSLSLTHFISLRVSYFVMIYSSFTSFSAFGQSVNAFLRSGQSSNAP